MKRMLTLALILGLAFSATSVYGGGTILLISDSDAPGSGGTDNTDDPLVSFLTGLGYTVDTSGMAKQYKEGDTSPFAAGNEAKLDALNNADLVIVSRRTGSGAYDNDRKGWNAVTAPLLLMSGYLTRGESSSKKWGWTTGGSGNADTAVDVIDIVAGQEGHPFLAGLSGPIDAFDWPGDPPAAPKGVYLPNSSGSEYGVEAVVIGTFDGRDMLVDIPAGADFDALNGTDDKYGVAGGRRAFLGHFGYDTPGTYDFASFITDDYKALLGNVVAEMIPEPATLALLGLGGLGLLRRKR